MTTIDTMIAQRNALADTMAECDDEAFPGSKAARAYSTALLALDAFDTAHPEVLAEIRRRDSEPRADAVNRALRGED